MPKSDYPMTSACSARKGDRPLSGTDKKTCDLPVRDAILCAQDLERYCVERGIWCTVVRQNEPDLRFIKIEVSIKISNKK